MLTRIFSSRNLWFLFVLASVVSSTPLGAQPGYDDFPIERFTREQGYNPDVEPLCFLQDKKGVMWIGTSDGLYRYDGTFRRYAHEAGNPFSLPKNRVVALYEDKENVLWVAIYNGGLARFDRAEERFTQYSARAGDTSSLPAADIGAIIEDGGGRFWLAVGDSGMVRFDRRTGKVARRYPLGAGAQSFALDASGQLWAASRSDGSLYIYSFRYFSEKVKLRSASQNDRFLYRYDERSDSFTRSPFELPFTANILTGAGDTLWAAGIYN